MYGNFRLAAANNSMVLLWSLFAAYLRVFVSTRRMLLDNNNNINNILLFFVFYYFIIIIIMLFTFVPQQNPAPQGRQPI